ncbi:hypothetical protein CBL_06731 [Carabus blaptoides fortunei]
MRKRLLDCLSQYSTFDLDFYPFVFVLSIRSIRGGGLTECARSIAASSSSSRYSSTLTRRKCGADTVSECACNVTRQWVYSLNPSRGSQFAPSEGKETEQRRKDKPFFFTSLTGRK